MDCYQLECFVRAFECQNFSQAAAGLFMAQTSLTYRISSLEKELGCTLFIRDKRGATPTDAARAIYQDALDMLDTRKRIEDHARRASTKRSETIHVGFNRYPNISLFFDAVGAYKANHPWSAVEIDLTYIDDVEYDLGNGNHDLIFYYDYDEKTFSTLDFLEFGASRYHALLGEGHPLSGRESLRIADLGNEVFAIPQQYSNSKFQVPSSDTLRRYGIAIDSSFADNDMLLLAVQTQRVFGIYPISQPQRMPGFVHVPIEDLEPLRYGILYPNHVTSEAVQGFIGFIHRYMAPRLPS